MCYMLGYLRATCGLYAYTHHDPRLSSVGLSGAGVLQHGCQFGWSPCTRPVCTHAACDNEMITGM